MKCTDCGGVLRATHVYVAGSGKTSTYVCMKCGTRSTFVLLPLGKAEDVGGAYAVAERMRAGKGPKLVGK